MKSDYLSYLSRELGEKIYASYLPYYLHLLSIYLKIVVYSLDLSCSGEN
jgi:hypothetical protein